MHLLRSPLGSVLYLSVMIHPLLACTTIRLSFYTLVSSFPPLISPPFIHHLVNLNCIHSSSSSSLFLLLLFQFQFLCCVVSPLTLASKTQVCTQSQDTGVVTWVCALACAYVRLGKLALLTHTHTHTHSHIPSRSFQDRYVCVCLSVCVRKRIFAFLSFLFSRLRYPLTGRTRHISHHCQGPCRSGGHHVEKVRELQKRGRSIRSSKWAEQRESARDERQWGNGWVRGLRGGARAFLPMLT